MKLNFPKKLMGNAHFNKAEDYLPQGLVLSKIKTMWRESSQT